MWLLDSFFDRFRWYRRWRGGKWELWYVDDPMHADIWHQVPEFARISGERPNPICRGTPKEEDWTR